MAASNVNALRNGRRHSRQIERQRADTAELIDALDDPRELADVARNLAALQGELAERWEMLTLAVPTAAPEPADEWLTIDAVAQLTGRSVSTIKHGPKDAIPGRRQLVPNGAVRWSRRAIERWIESFTVPSN